MRSPLAAFALSGFRNCSLLCQSLSIDLVALTRASFVVRTSGPRISRNTLRLATFHLRPSRPEPRV